MKDGHSRKDIEYHARTAHLYDMVVSEPREFANNILFAPIDKEIHKSARMLDIGCGTGQMLLRYASRFSHVTGVDHSDAMLNLARQRLGNHGIKNVELIEDDVIRYLSSTPHYYDLITCVGCLHHLARDDIGTFFKLASLRLNSNGILLIAEPINISEESMPDVVKRWNRQSVMPKLSNLLHLVDVEEADEGPVEEAMIHPPLEYGLKPLVRNRSWELFPHHMPPTFNDRLMIRFLHWRYGQAGNILAQAWRK